METLVKNEVFKTLDNWATDEKNFFYTTETEF